MILLSGGIPERENPGNVSEQWPRTGVSFENNFLYTRKVNPIFGQGQKFLSNPGFFQNDVNAEYFKVKLN